ncbi:MAG: ABC transporter permease [Desulfobacterales bacterium]|nr:ABC transporter permease [Desulfobacterales bacterium]
MQWLKIALRNLLKNRRRSLVTLMAVAIGFAAVGLFRGYTANTYEGLRQSAIRGEGLGHLTIYKAGWAAHAHGDPQSYMLTPAEIEKIIAVTEADPHVLLATPQLHVAGLVSNGRISNIFLAKGVVPADYRTITGGMSGMRAMQGQDLSPEAPFGVLMARDLATQLDMPPDSDGVIMATTLDGQMNALDIRVSGTYDTGSDATNDKYLLLSYAYAQSLYDTDRADRLIVLLDHWRYTQAARLRFEQQLTAAGVPCEIKSWEELSLFYSKVKGMFDMIFMFIFLIVLIIVVMSTVNTMGMSVMERTREIGTLRVLGLKRRGISVLFALEGALLGLLGSLCGVVLNLVVWAVIRMAGPSYIPPGVSTPVPLVVNLLPVAMLVLALFLTLLSMAAAVLPARRAARMELVDALGHV